MTAATQTTLALLDCALDVVRAEDPERARVLAPPLRRLAAGAPPLATERERAAIAAWPAALQAAGVSVHEVRGRAVAWLCARAHVTPAP